MKSPILLVGSVRSVWLVGRRKNLGASLSVRFGWLVGFGCLEACLVEARVTASGRDANVLSKTSCLSRLSFCHGVPLVAVVIISHFRGTNLTLRQMSNNVSHQD